MAQSRATAQLSWLRCVLLVNLVRLVKWPSNGLNKLLNAGLPDDHHCVSCGACTWCVTCTQVVPAQHLMCTCNNHPSCRVLSCPALSVPTQAWHCSLCCGCGWLPGVGGLLRLLCPVTGGLMWRTAKADVAAEMGMPPQHHHTTVLRLSAIERHWYNRWAIVSVGNI